MYNCVANRGRFAVKPRKGVIPRMLDAQTVIAFVALITLIIILIDKLTDKKK